MSSTNSNNSNQVLQISKKLMEIIDNLLKYSLDNCLIFFFRQGTLQGMGENPVNLEQWIQLIQVRFNKIN